jgi:hypothetical protein
MSKKKTFAPFIVLSGMNPPGPGDDTGDGSDHGGLDDYGGQSTSPVSYDEWAKHLGPDAVDSFEAYGQWWADNGFGMDAWTEFNPNASFTWNPEDDL